MGDRERTRDRDRDRDRDRERRHRNRDRERTGRDHDRESRHDRDHERDRHDRDYDRHDRRDRRRSRSRSRSPHQSKRSSTPVFLSGPSGNHNETTADLTPEEKEMQQLMGFASFHTTKGKKVEGNAKGAVHVIMKRKYRQYMNRKGGFNRPLDFVA